jgi:hypothetical protein
MRTTAALVMVGLAMSGSAQAADTIDMTHKPIQIPPEALRDALPKVGEIEGLHLVFLTEDLEHRNTAGVSGSLTPVEALEQVLRGTGLTYRFLEARTVIILPAGLARGAPDDLNSGSGSGDNPENGVSAPTNAAARVPQVTVTAARPSNAQNLEYFRLLAAMSRLDYRRMAKTLDFVDSGTVTFRGFQLPLGQHRQSARLDGIVLSRVFKFGKDTIDKWLEAYNANSFPVFVEIDSGTNLGNGAYAALAPGEAAIWTWNPTGCAGGPIGSAFPPGSGLVQGGGLHDWGCADYPIQPGTFRVRMLKR